MTRPGSGDAALMPAERSASTGFRPVVEGLRAVGEAEAVGEGLGDGLAGG